MRHAPSYWDEAPSYKRIEFNRTVWRWCIFFRVVLIAFVALRCYMSFSLKLWPIVGGIVALTAAWYVPYLIYRLIKKPRKREEHDSPIR